MGRTPGMVMSRRTAGRLSAMAGERPLEHLHLLLECVMEAQSGLDQLSLVIRQGHLGQQGPALLAEEVGGLELDEVARADGVDLVARGGALAHKPGAVRHPPAQGPGLSVGHPDLGQEVGGAELREDLRVDLVGLDLACAIAFVCIGVRDRDPTDVLRQQIDDRPRDRRRLWARRGRWAQARQRTRGCPSSRFAPFGAPGLPRARPLR